MPGRFASGAVVFSALLRVFWLPEVPSHACSSTSDRVTGSSEWFSRIFQE